jgi:hypothetical protein
VLIDASGEPLAVVLPVEVLASRAAPDRSKRRVSCRLEEVDRDLHELLVEYCDVVIAAGRFSRSGPITTHRRQRGVAAGRSAA